MIRVWVSSISAGDVIITGAEHHYLANVRRARVGERIEVADSAGWRATAVIGAITAKATTVRCKRPEPVAQPAPHVTALVPLIKGDRMEQCVEKLAEVGCSALVVWNADRAVVRLDAGRAAARADKLQDVARAATRQSGRVIAMAVSHEAARDRAIAGACGVRFVLVPDAPQPALAELAALVAHDRVTVASGPEGGFEPHEVAAFTAAGFTPLGLGPRVLRAETAPVIAVALIRAATRS
jgi:16S rRNA (uracil1498-N3)-methyltransferase